MSEIAKVLTAIDAGDPGAASQLLPLVYDELRKLAAAKLANEKPGQTLDATGLVHEAYLRLIGPSVQFVNRAQFFAAAAEAMRRILIENARRRVRQRHGGGLDRVDLHSDLAAIDGRNDEMLAVHEALELLATEDRSTAELVKLHYFGGLKLEDAAEVLGIRTRTAYRNWAFARAWLFRKLNDN